MKTVPHLPLIVLAAFLTACAPVASLAAETASSPAAAPLAPTVAELLSALEQNDHAAFIAKGDADFQGKLSKPAFAAATAALAPRLKAGYTLAHLGDLKQHGAQVALWKVTFKDGGDDALATLVTRADKVAGFWVK